MFNGACYVGIWGLLRSISVAEGLSGTTSPLITSNIDKHSCCNGSRQAADGSIGGRTRRLILTCATRSVKRCL